MGKQLNYDSRIDLKLSEEQKQVLQQLAAANTMTVSEFIRAFSNGEIAMLQFLANLIRSLNLSCENLQNYDRRLVGSAIFDLNTELEHLQDNLCVLDGFHE